MLGETITKELVCINCPMGCRMSAELRGGEVASVSGFGCKRGETYAHEELTNPTRTVTALVRVKGREAPLSVKTNKPIPKKLVFEALEGLRAISVAPPVSIGDAVQKNICGSGADFIATANIHS